MAKSSVCIAICPKAVELPSSRQSHNSLICLQEQLQEASLPTGFSPGRVSIIKLSWARFWKPEDPGDFLNLSLVFHCFKCYSIWPSSPGFSNRQQTLVWGTEPTFGCNDLPPHADADNIFSASEVIVPQKQKNATYIGTDQNCGNKFLFVHLAPPWSWQLQQVNTTYFPGFLTSSLQQEWQKTLGLYSASNKRRQKSQLRQFWAGYLFGFAAETDRNTFHLGYFYRVCVLGIYTLQNTDQQALWNSSCHPLSPCMLQILKFLSINDRKCLFAFWVQ